MAVAISTKTVSNARKFAGALGAIYAAGVAFVPTLEVKAILAAATPIVIFGTELRAADFLAKREVQRNQASRNLHIRAQIADAETRRKRVVDACDEQIGRLELRLATLQSGSKEHEAVSGQITEARRVSLEAEKRLLEEMAKAYS